MFLEEVDAGDKGLALNAVLVEVIRMPVRGGDENNAVGHEGFEEAAQDHGVGDICTLELVETQDLGGFGNVGCDKRNGVELAAMLHADLMEAFVDILHEVVEVDTGFGGLVGWEGVVEEIHQHGLAGSHISVHVEALG